jgi:hypothetical protein
VVTFNNVEYGFIGYGIDSVFTRITSFANGHPIALWDGTGITLSHVTTANNAHHGVWSYAVPNVTAVQILAVNNAFDGVQLDAGATGGVFAQTAVSDNLERGVGPQGLGLCAVGSGGEGLVDGSCSDTGIDGSATYGASASDAVLRIDGIGASGSLVGAVIDDTRNTSHTMGLRAYGSIDDWVTFENRFRGWGRQSTDPFPGASHVGRCDGGSCRIWDLRLRGTDTVFRNTSGDGRTPNEPFVASAVCPGAVHGDRALSDRLTTPNTFLVNALEVLDDGIGDDDGLCESSEACIYSPNFGAYQGEGDYVAGGTCDFADGIVSDVTMYAHPLNGG